MDDYSYCTAAPYIYKLLKEFARENRAKPTEAEMVLWRELRGNQLGVTFRRQHIIGEYIADFVSLSTKIIIELDGRYHSLPEQQISDEERTQWLKQHGFKVIRFTNEQVLCDIDNVLLTIKKNMIYGTEQK
jgi:very-short-patch-repair endonuclease